MRSATLVALGASFSAASAAVQGFNYGATKTDGSFMFQQDFQDKFANAKNLVGTSGFTSARLYTMIQGGSSTNEPTQAIPAAINEGVTLLLGLWASAGAADMQAEITALKSAITQYGTAFTSLVVGISVGSEDLYRNSPTGIAALSGAGANPADLVTYIGEVRSALQGTALSGASIGHVDTWTSWVNASNNEVAAACDWIGMDAYPYFQNTMDNDISTGKQLFDDALSATQAAVGGKPVWVTETGWPVSGKTEGQGVPSTANAQTYWQQVGCPLFGNVNTWWFTMQDADPTTPNPSFGLVGSTLSTTPLYDLSCSAVSSSSSSQAASSTVASSGATVSSGAASSDSSSSAGGGNGQASQASSANQASQASGQTVSPPVASSIIASLSSAVTASTLVTGGSGLGPSQGVPVVSNPSATPTGTGGGVSPSAPSVAIGNGTSPASSTLSSSPGSSTGTSSGGSSSGGSSSGGSSPGTSSVPANAAVALSAGPLFGAASLFAAALAIL